MRRFFDPSAPVLNPADIVRAFTKKDVRDLVLPRRAVILFAGPDLSALVRKSDGQLIEGWKPFRTLYRAREKETILVKSPFGGPNVAALVEELSFFGVREFCLWGYCGGISRNTSVGDLLLVTRALREEGTSYHYLEDGDEFVASPWAAEWEQVARKEGMVPGAVWTCDALYREGRDKAARYGAKGILGVEMEAASLYAVCRAKALKGVAFLVVSDLVHETGWQGGFESPDFKNAAKRLSAFILKHVII